MVRISRRKEAMKPMQEDNDQHVIAQLPIMPANLSSDYAGAGAGAGAGGPSGSGGGAGGGIVEGDPSAYQPFSQYESCPAESMIPENEFDTLPEDKKTYCFWCCHPVTHTKVGLPIRYDAMNDTYVTMGCFCSYECAAAYNFDHYQGTDRMWEINSWIQIFADKMGLDTPIRPAPSRYTLQMFGGPMNIHEFRAVHKNHDRLVLCNIPPLITVMPQTESVNTSYMTPHIDVDRLQQAHEKLLTRKKTILQTETKNSLDSKLKLTFSIGPGGAAPVAPTAPAPAVAVSE